MTDTLTTITKFDDIGTNINKNTLGESQVVNLYQDTSKASTEPEPKVETKAELKDKTETEVSRRDSLKRISERERKTMEKEKLANEKMAKVEQFHESFKKFEEDPTLIAKAFNMSTEEFLRKYQNKIFDIKEDSPKPETVAQDRLSALEDQTKRLSELNFQNQKSNYVNQFIVPILSQQPEKFELVNEKMAAHANYIHDIIHHHWMETGGNNGGEIWEAKTVAEELEKELTENKEKEIEELKKSPKLRKYFKEESVNKIDVEITHLNKTSPKTITSSLGSNADGGLPQLPQANKDGNKIIYQSLMDPKEAKRQKTAAAIRQQFPERFTKNKK